jgi:C_GCAxxG_C_C family probable redox protein
MEEFGLGTFDIIRALSPFPGFAMTGRICGAVTGGLIALGLYFGSDDMTNHAANRAATRAARVFLARMEETFGSLDCPSVETLLLGRYYFDSKDSKANSDAFARDKGLAKCTVAPRIGARLAAEIIIENMEGKNLQ